CNRNELEGNKIARIKALNNLRFFNRLTISRYLYDLKRFLVRVTCAVLVSLSKLKQLTNLASESINVLICFKVKTLEIEPPRIL
ncbi:hypothetical protein, partial [Pseudoalteromonas sp. 43-MNA-CIBAN-0464]|uniref:hypothetical protein n=1 Tax=Pseudoalteromonas sp. 43-MNA-CIBAN-0464 TaxID=3140425 RepID=UPI00332FDEA0